MNRDPIIFALGLMILLALIAFGSIIVWVWFPHEVFLKITVTCVLLFTMCLIYLRLEEFL